MTIPKNWTAGLDHEFVKYAQHFFCHATYNINIFFSYFLDVTKVNRWWSYVINVFLVCVASQGFVQSMILSNFLPLTKHVPNLIFNLTSGRMFYQKKKNK